ncbi:nucleoside 2-deoxyribosyltransferase [Rhodococcus sp. HS-D2]|uniref:nucleoside 2-deoxyribosyltransferase n=1 Tax=Rhodococcus sp. HS-D2 TaxID=1384636 RepID=UPI0007D8EE3C|nr:nucleoside 2-deoxyribosyltransferase [Rhodococcus sp. HS-D2]
MRVFVAAPFGPYLGSDGAFDPLFRRHLEDLYAHLSSAGLEYFSAQVNENWGASPLTPPECVPIDYKELASADAVVAILGNPPSLGVAIELGWASALQKPILIVGTAIAASSMIAGLDRVADVRFIDFDLGSGPGASGADIGRLVLDQLLS